MATGHRVFITGGAGFIGTALTERLVPANRVTIFDNFRRDSLGYTALAEDPNVTVVKGDILDSALLERSLDGCDVIIHLAAIAGVDTVVSHPAETLRVNLIGTYNLLEAAKNLDLQRVVLFSTSEVFGPFVFRGDESSMTTQGPVGEPRWVYGTSKLASEHLGYAYWREHGLPFVAVRPFNIYGPQQIGEGAVHHFILKALRNEQLVVHNDGNQIRSWCFIDDLTTAVLKILERSEAVGEVFNVGNPRATCTVLGLAEHIVRLAGSSSNIAFLEIPYPDVEVRVPAITKAQELLGFHPHVGLERGLTRTIAWYRERVVQES